MNKLNFLSPDKNNLYAYLYLGISLFSFSILIVFLNSFFNLDLTSFLPGTISYFLPLIVGFIGLHLIRIEYSGIKFLDIINNDKRALNLFVLIFLLIMSKNFIPEYSILTKCKPMKPIIRGKK